MDPLAVAAAVVEVTLLEDRAFVRRQGRITLPAGTLVVTVDGVAPALVDKTLTAAVEGAPVKVVAPCLARLPAPAVLVMAPLKVLLPAVPVVRVAPLLTTTVPPPAPG